MAAMAVVGPAPPCAWPIWVASARARTAGTPWASSDVVTRERSPVTRMVPRMARPRLAE
jgi:hypothetical protein